MLSIRDIRRRPDWYKTRLAERGVNPDQLDALLELDARRRDRLAALDGERMRQRQLQSAIYACRGRGEATDHLVAELKTMGTAIRILEKEVQALHNHADRLVRTLPNVPRGTKPMWTGEPSIYGEPVEFPYPPQSWKALAVDLGILRFGGLVGEGASLVRGLGNVFTDSLAADGFLELPTSGKDIWERLADVILESPTERFVQQQGGWVTAVLLLTPDHWETQEKRLSALLAGVMAEMDLVCQVRPMSLESLPAHSADGCRVEIWFPHAKKYRPAIFITDDGDYLARAARLRLRPPREGKAIVAHTGGIAVDLEAVAGALLESGQRDNGSVVLPEMLAARLGRDRFRRK